jgi:hypothetical protein
MTCSHGGDYEDHEGDEEAVQTSEAMVNSYQSTRRQNPEDSHVPIETFLDTNGFSAIEKYI